MVSDAQHASMAGKAMSRKGTGPTRLQHPLYVEHLPPCNTACPAGENIQAWLSLVQRKEYRLAWQVILRDNPMPAVHGRVCYHPCENACNRRDLDDTVRVHAVERFLGDMAIDQGWEAPEPAPATGKRVLVVGAGPSGLSAAYHLRKLGHTVDIYEAGPMAGGMMHFGIPKYRLPRDILEAEIRRIEAMGVTITCNRRVDDLEKVRAEGNYDAVFLAIGAHLSRQVNIPARDAAPIYDAISFLRQAETGETPKMGRRVAVYGGGNTAVDAARTARRLGAEETVIIYRRDREHAPAHDFEIDEAHEEGIKIHWLRTISGVEGGRIRVEEMELDARGLPQPTGRFETLEADCLIVALGQQVDAGFLKKVRGLEIEEDGTIKVNAQMMTGAEGIFAGGDMVPYQRSVTVATGHGKRAARCIDQWLRGQSYRTLMKNPAIAFGDLHLWYYTDAPARQENKLEVARRLKDFGEVYAGLDEEQAHYESRRCLSCGNCFECDGCFGACPEGAIVKLGPGKGYRIDLDKCTGCAVCFDQCPCHALEMVAETASAL